MEEVRKKRASYMRAYRAKTLEVRGLREFYNLRRGREALTLFFLSPWETSPAADRKCAMVFVIATSSSIFMASVENRVLGGAPDVSLMCRRIASKLTYGRFVLSLSSSPRMDAISLTCRGNIAFERWKISSVCLFNRSLLHQDNEGRVASMKGSVYCKRFVIHFKRLA